MNDVVKQKWCEALESGEFQQVRGCLNNGNGYCCLGVLCELHRREHLYFRWELRNTGQYQYLKNHEILPDDVRRWAGLAENNPTVPNNQDPEFGIKMTSLANLNDGGVPFNEIAEIIREQL